MALPDAISAPFQMRDLTGEMRLVIFAEEARPLRGPRKGNADPYADLSANLRSLRALNRSDAALARALDEA